jgi:hypothetical protein
MAACSYLQRSRSLLGWPQGDLHANATRLDRRTCADVPFLWRRAASHRAGQSQEWRSQGFVLRSGDQSQLWHDGCSAFTVRIPPSKRATSLRLSQRALLEIHSAPHPQLLLGPQFPSLGAWLNRLSRQEMDNRASPHTAIREHPLRPKSAVSLGSLGQEIVLLRGTLPWPRAHIRAGKKLRGHFCQ